MSLIAHAVAQGNGSTAATTSALDTTGATLLVVAVCDYDSSAASTVSDSKSNSWTALTAQISGTSEGRTRLLYAANPTVGASHTFSAQGTAAYPAIAVAAFSGMATTSPFDVQNGNHVVNTNTSIQPGAITPSEDNEVVVFANGGNAATTISVNVGTIADQLPLIGGVAFPICLAYEIQTTATARNPTFSWSPAAAAQAVIASFKSAAAVARTPRPLNVTQAVNRAGTY